MVELHVHVHVGDFCRRVAFSVGGRDGVLSCVPPTPVGGRDGVLSCVPPTPVGGRDGVLSCVPPTPVGGRDGVLSCVPPTPVGGRDGVLSCVPPTPVGGRDGVLSCVPPTPVGGRDGVLSDGRLCVTIFSGTLGCNSTWMTPAALATTRMKNHLAFKVAICILHVVYTSQISLPEIFLLLGPRCLLQLFSLPLAPSLDSSNGGLH